MPNNTRVMGFDFGEKRIGVAVGNCQTATANGVCVLHAKQGKPDWNEVRNLIRQWQPFKLIVGYPSSFDDTELPATKPAQKFANRLAHETGLPVTMVDERLTSREARAMNKELKQDRVDHLAAQIIVQSWLCDQKKTDSQTF